jgi:hypothetical protein
VGLVKDIINVRIIKRAIGTKNLLIFMTSLSNAGENMSIATAMRAVLSETLKGVHLISLN